jgi:hypothetical protein
MAVVKVKFTGPANELGVRVDDDVLALDDQGEAQDDISTGAHSLTFFVIGPPGGVCHIAITAPPEAAWEHDVPIPANGVNGGFKNFMIPTEAGL